MKTNSIITLAALATLFSGCVSLSRENFEETTESTLEKIIYLASLAGNSHNTQPWYVVIENDSLIRICADFSRKLHIVDPDARGLFISIGAFIENFELAAGSFGYSAEINFTAEDNNDTSVAVIRLKQSEKSSFDISRIETRRTLRTPFRKESLSDEHLNFLKGNNSSEIYYFPYNSVEGEFIAENALSAYAMQAFDEQAKHELASWMRFSNKDVELHRDGLTTSGMGITGFGGFMVRNFYKPEDSMKDSFIKKGIENTREMTDNCGGWIFIVQKDNSPESWIKTGRLYQRMNLFCREFMIGMHPMNQMIEEPEYEKVVNEKLSLPGTIQFAARVGYVDEYPEANSVRRPVKDIIRRNKQ